LRSSCCAEDTPTDDETDTVGEDDESVDAVVDLSSSLDDAVVAGADSFLSLKNFAICSTADFVSTFVPNGLAVGANNDFAASSSVLDEPQPDSTPGGNEAKPPKPPPLLKPEPKTGALTLLPLVLELADEDEDDEEEMDGDDDDESDEDAADDDVDADADEDVDACEACVAGPNENAPMAASVLTVNGLDATAAAALPLPLALTLSLPLALPLAADVGAPKENEAAEDGKEKEEEDEADAVLGATPNENGAALLLIGGFDPPNENGVAASLVIVGLKPPNENVGTLDVDVDVESPFACLSVSVTSSSWPC